MPISGISDKDGAKKITTTTSGTKELLDVAIYGANGTLINGGTLVPEAYDAIYVTYNGASETYTYKSLGATVAVITVTYETTAKINITSVIRT